MEATFPTRVRRRFGGRRSSARGHRLSKFDRIWIAALILVTLVALFGPLLAPHDPRAGAGPAFEPPSWSYPMGTDEAGRDIFSRVLAGIQLTWLSAALVITIGLIVGGLVGLIAAATGGLVDSALMRLTDVFLALPASLLAIAVIAALGPSLGNTLLAVSLLWWPYYARVVRAEARAIVARPHMEAAKLAGVGWWRRLGRHLLPGVIPVAIVAASLDIANLIIILAGLSFLGLGAPPPAPELGAMTANGLSQLLNYWWIPIAPAAAVFILSLTGNLAGDAIRDRLDG